jgi:hypothetical protein
MAKRTNHYDAAFEAYLRRARVPFVVVDEARRARRNQVSLKSMDFIVTAPGNRNLLVDVKGRQFPSGRGPQRASARAGHRRIGTKWENWATKDDLDSLLRWQEVFGDGFRALLGAADDPPAALKVGPEAAFCHRGRVYSFFGVWADLYRTAMHARSQSWETVSVPSREYRDLRIPFAELLGC